MSVRSFMLDSAGFYLSCRCHKNPSEKKYIHQFSFSFYKNHQSSFNHHYNCLGFGGPVFCITEFNLINMYSSYKILSVLLDNLVSERCTSMNWIIGQSQRLIRSGTSLDDIFLIMSHHPTLNAPRSCITLQAPQITLSLPPCKEAQEETYPRVIHTEV